MSFNEVIQRLEAYTDTSEWERICCDILTKLGCRGIEPQSVGAKDGGKDAVVWNTSLGNIAVHMSLRKDWKKKLFEDLEKTKGKNYQKVIFCSNQKINGITKDNLRLEVKEKYKVIFDIFDQERFRVEIENNRPDLLRKLGLANLDIYINHAELLSLPTKPDRASKLKILQKYLNGFICKNDFIKISKKDDKPCLDIQPFTKPIQGTFKFKFKQDKLEGYTDFQKFLNDKLSEGEDIIFTEEEIEDLKIDNPYGETPDGTPTMLKISAEAIDKEINVDIEILNSDITYQNLKIAPISRKEEYAVVKSFNSPLILILKTYKPLEDKIKIDCKFRLDNLCNDLFQGIKFNKFLKAIKENKQIIIRKSDTKEIILKGNMDKDLEFDDYWLELLNKIYFIGQKLNLNFPFPKSLDSNEIEIINTTYEAIKNKKLQSSFDEQELEFESSKIKDMIKSFEEKGYIENAQISFGGLQSKLLGKDIDLGKGIAKLPLLKITDNLEKVKKEIEKSEKVKFKVMSLNENERYDIILVELEDK
ncbi:MAG: hypothetical protein ACOCP4_02440 [Candidatus Woesearchaeota archaeon]